MTQGAFRRDPRIAAGLAMLFGGAGFLYLGVWRGLMALALWLVILFLAVPIAAPALEQELPRLLLLLLLVNFPFALRAYRLCQSDIQAGERPTSGEAPREPSRLLRALRVVAGAIAAFVVLFCFLLVWYLYSTGSAARQVEHARLSIHVGMTVPEVLHAIKEPCSIHAPGGAFSWPYGGLDPASGKLLSISEQDATEKLQQSLSPDRETEFELWFFRGYGSSFRFTVVVGPDGRVREVKPLRPISPA